MTASLGFRRPPILLVSIVMLAVAGRAYADEVTTVTIDQATITKLPERAATIVIGNPLIADVSVQAGGLMVITGKGYGITNLIALDRGGAVLTERNIQVVGPDNLVVVYRGAHRESYSCAPQCEPRMMLGDDSDHFNETMGQIVSRSARAQGLGAAGQGAAAGR
jgi:hypothetical protein